MGRRRKANKYVELNETDSSTKQYNIIQALQDSFKINSPIKSMKIIFNINMFPNNVDTIHKECEREAAMNGLTSVIDTVNSGFLTEKFILNSNIKTEDVNETDMMFLKTADMCFTRMSDYTPHIIIE